MSIQMSSGFASGTLASASPFVVSMSGAPLPSTVTLRSSAAGRLIEISTDGGIEWFAPTVDRSSTTSQIVNLTASVSHVRFTGVANDAWSIR